jgi:structural maintenance of chromosome 1
LSGSSFPYISLPPPLTPSPLPSLGDSEQRFRDIDSEFDQAREDTRKARDAFNSIKKKRCDLFNKAFKHIEDRIDEVYKDLTKGRASPQGGVAYLSLDEPEVRFILFASFFAPAFLS